LKQLWDEDELYAYWKLTSGEQTLLAGRTGHGPFRFAVQLTFFQHERRFPESRRSLPAKVVRNMAEQLSMPINALERFDWAGRTAKHQRTEYSLGLCTTHDGQSLGVAFDMDSNELSAERPFA